MHSSTNFYLTNIDLFNEFALLGLLGCKNLDYNQNIEKIAITLSHYSN